MTTPPARPDPNEVIVRPSVADPARPRQPYRILPAYQQADAAYAADYTEALSRLLVWAFEDGCELGEVVATAARRAAARLGGPHRLLARRPGSWEAAALQQLTGGWEHEAKPQGRRRGQ
jgi:hypothetical protein